MVILSFIAGVAAIQKEGSMEGFDLRILVLILLTLNMLGFLIYLYARFSTLRMAGMELWAGGHLALVVCFFGVLLNIESPNPPLLFLIVIFLLTTHTLWLSASRSFFHKERLDPLLVFLPAFMVVAFAVCAVTPLALNWIEEDTLFRTGYILLFITCAFYQLAIAKEFICYRSPRLFTSVFVGCTFAVVAVISILSAIIAPESLSSLRASSTTYPIATLTLVAFIQIIFMLGLMLISAERLQCRLNGLVQNDPLTGLLNRSGFMSQSEIAIMSRRKNDKICAIMAFDLNHFKLINETYGHSTGDDFLIAFTHCLTENTRATDILARFGGEDFIVLCVDVDHTSAKNTAKRISNSMAALTVQSSTGENLSITVSVGMAMIDDDRPDLNLYLETANKALYDAKASGRNKIVMAEHSSHFSVLI